MGQLSEILNPTGQFNIYIKDVDSVVTGYGKHQRVCAFLPSFDKDYGQTVLYCRVDRKYDLPDPTIKEVLTVARKDQGVKGKWELLNMTEYFSNGMERIEYNFTRKG